VQVRIVADQRESYGRNSKIAFLEQCGVAVRLSRGYRGNRSITHDKFAVFDGSLAVTGSYNWTVSADRHNFENAVFIRGRHEAEDFEHEFERIWEQAR
jgi:phosphatidylserine/phosphatidylglycerophosphate/cardiolipin synthase-like enzyme